MAKTKAQLAAEAKKTKAAIAKAPAAAKTPAAKTAPVAEAPAAVAAINLQHLSHIVTQTNTQGFCYSPAEVNAPLIAAGLVESNAESVDDKGHFATRATQAGVDYLTAQSSPFAASVPAPAAASTPAPAAVETPAPAAAPAPVASSRAPAGGFKIATGVPLPTVARGFGAKAALYPFASLEVGQSFFVAATEKRPNPAKAMASTVNSATQRFMLEDGTDEAGKTKFKKTRTFALRNVEDGEAWGQPGVKGAGIFRTA